MSVLYIQVYIYLQTIGHYPAFVSSYYYSERDRLESGNLTDRFVSGAVHHQRPLYSDATVKSSFLISVTASG
jgi:hypothetical protein